MKGWCHDWSSTVCRALKIGFVWLENSWVFIYTLDCVKEQLTLFLLYVHVPRCIYAVFSHCT